MGDELAKVCANGHALERGNVYRYHGWRYCRQCREASRARFLTTPKGQAYLLRRQVGIAERKVFKWTVLLADLRAKLDKVEGDAREAD